MPVSAMRYTQRRCGRAPLPTCGTHIIGSPSKLVNERFDIARRSIQRMRFRATNFEARQSIGDCPQAVN
jgi:hypothetical protein